MDLPPNANRERVWISRSADQTRSLGRALAAHLDLGDLVCLRGDLGAGKTTLIQGLGEGLGVVEPMTSPSFTLIHEHRGRLPLYHLDLYRLAPGDLDEVGVEDIIGSAAVVVVEWAERLPVGLRRGALEIEIGFDTADPNWRRLRFSGSCRRSAEIIRRMEREPHARTRD